MICYKIFFLQSVLLLSFANCDSKHSSNLNNLYNNFTLTRNNVTKNNSIEEVGKTKVNIKVYYETLCPASVDFFTLQLAPVIEKLAAHIDVRLIPYGHATTRLLDGRYYFRCQHGHSECHGNKLHACVVDALQNNTKAALYNVCLMQYAHYFDSTAMNWCGNQLDVPVNGIWECMNTERGSELLMNYGEETHRLRPRYVPYVMLDDSIDKQDQATVNLMSTICNMLKPTPASCT